MIQSHLTLCDPMGCSSPGFPVHGILQARILQWVAISFSKESSRPWDRTCVSAVSCIGTRFFFTTSVTLETKFHLQQRYSCGGGGGLVNKLCPTLTTPRTVACQAPLSMRFSRQRILEWVAIFFSRDIPDPGIEPKSPALEGSLLHCRCFFFN